ncbi:hypothetical protein [Rothia nasimurium]|uniref:hypothetical protein n=1 Tax=Rothia nasimurium TaxID=85336 RepID=UPI001F3AEC1F|nr:hypothetical protein [Rothia nasimurium]
MTVNKYPEDIYPKLGFRTDGFGRLTYRTTYNSDFERAYDLGYQDGQQAQGDHPLAGWSNLTEAIADGERIDWEKLDGLEAKCVHPELGALTHRMERDSAYPPYEYVGWDEEASFAVWSEAFYSAWYGRNGWSLWVKGDLPLRKLTANQLALGTIFIGKCPAEGEDMSPEPMFRTAGHVIAFDYFQLLQVDPSEVEVYKVVGQLKTPKEDA